MSDDICFADQYLIGQHILGQGQFGEVVLGYDLFNDRQIACKKVKHYTLQKNQKFSELFAQEVQLQSSINSPFTVQLYNIYHNNNVYYMMLEYCDGGDLKSYVQKNGPLTEQKSIGFLLQILTGLRALHKKSVAHRDLKPANIFMSGEILKIGDFGACRTFESGNEGQTYIGTPLFLAPEIQEGIDYGFEVDIYSLGGILYFMLFNDYPFHGKTAVELFNNMKKGYINFNKNGVRISQQMIDFITKLLKYDRNERISWSQIYQHEIITNYIKKNNQFEIDIIHSQQEIQMYLDSKFSNQKGQNGFNHKNTQMGASNIRPNNIKQEEIQKDFQIGKQKYTHQINIYNFLIQLVNSFEIFSYFGINYQIPAYLVEKKVKSLNQELLKSIKEKKNIFNMKFFKNFIQSKIYQEIENKLSQDSKNIQNFINVLQFAAIQSFQKLRLLNDGLKQELKQQELTLNFKEYYIGSLISYNSELQKRLKETMNLDEKAEIFKSIIYGYEACRVDELFKDRHTYDFQQHDQQLSTVNPSSYIELTEKQFDIIFT